MRRTLTSPTAAGLVAATAFVLMAAVGVPPAAAAPAAAAPAAPAPAAPAPAYRPIGTVVEGEFRAALNPAAAPPGVNLPDCRLTTAHPRPIVLVNGTTQVMQSSFGYLGPTLANAGYCVYGYNYGGDPSSPIQATGPVLDAVTALQAQVTRVKALTGAAKVDIVGYSQGGLVAELYTKFGGAANVNAVIGLSPTTHGTTLLGLATLGRLLGLAPLVRAGFPALGDQLTGSDVVRMLNTGPVAQPGVQYTVIDSKYEDIVTPAGISFIREPGVVNQYVQDTNPFDLTEHIGLPYSATTATLTLRALARASANRS